jgi:hypothetical protein
MIKLRKLLEVSDADLINQIEQDIFYFRIFEKRYHKELREKQGYKRELKIVLPIVKKLGFERAAEVYRAARKYTATVYGRMNKALRADKTPAKTDLIDQYIAIAPKFKGNMLYRGIGKELYQILTTTKSKTFVDKAFMSSTTEYSTAQQFAKRTGKGAVLVLTGALSKAAQAPETIDVNNGEGEAEYIFPRNTRLKITKIDGDKIHITIL